MIVGFECKDPKWVKEGEAVDVLYNHKTLGWVTYTVVNNSGEARMQQIWDAVLFGEYGPIAQADSV